MYFLHIRKMWKDKISNLLADAKLAFQRFPHVIICSIIFSVLLCYDEGTHHRHAVISNLLMTFGLGIPAYFALAVFDERYTMRRNTAYIFHGILAGLLFLYWFTLPAEMNEVSRQRYFMLLIAAHLGVSLAPFVVNGSQNGFWQYNTRILIRFIVCSLFSVLLMSGLAFALYSANQLFHKSVLTEAIPYLYYLIITVNTCFFLMGVPQNVVMLDRETVYPQSLKVFSAYVLLPLVILFFIILYAYSVKTIAGTGPEELLVTNLIIALSVSGILVYLLLWPLRKSDNFWIRRYNSYFFPVLMPLVIILAVLTARQVQSSFLKVEHYIIIVYCIMLAILSGIFIFTRRKNIRLIPILFIIGIFAAGFGPWNAFSSSRKSITDDLILEFQKHGRIKNEMLVSSDVRLNTESAARINNMLDYLERMYGLDVLEPYMNAGMKKKIFQDRKDYNKRFELLAQLNISDGAPGEVNHYYTVQADLINVKGFDYFVYLNMNEDRSVAVIHDIFPDSSLLHWNYNQDIQILSLIVKSDTIHLSGRKISDSVLRNAGEKGVVGNPAALNFEEQSGNFKVSVNIQNITLSNRNKISAMNGYVLFSVE